MDAGLGPEEYDIDPDDPFTFDDPPAVTDGDLPPMPAALTKDFLPRDLLEGHEVEVEVEVGW